MNSLLSSFVTCSSLSESLSLAQDPDPRLHSDPTGFDRVSIHRVSLTLPFLPPHLSGLFLPLHSATQGSRST